MEDRRGCQLGGILLLASACVSLSLIGGAYTGLVNAGMKSKSATFLLAGVLLLIIAAVCITVFRSAKSYEEE